MEFCKPGPNKRVCAFFIDSIIGQVCGLIISSAITRDVSWIIWAVFILFKDCFNGQSVGKYLVGMQIIDEANLPAKSSKTILRNLFMVIPLFPLVEYVWMRRDKEGGKRIGDNTAKTRVSDLKPQRKDGTFLWISIALAIVVFMVQLGLGVMLIKQHPELLKKP